MSVSEYIARREHIEYNTTFRITPNGKGFYVEGDKLYTREEFRRCYPMPVSLVTHNKPNFDSTQNFLHID